MSTSLGVAHRKPNFPMPRGACDCHVHIFGSHDEFPFARDRVYMPGLATVEDLLAMHRAIGISRVVVVQASPQGTDNRCLVRALNRLNSMGHQARGIAVVDPSIQTEELEKLREAGVRGLRVNLESFKQNDPGVAREALRETAIVAAKMGWHVQVYSNLRVVRAVASLIAELPVPIVLDNFGLASPTAGVQQDGLEETLELVRSGHLYVKLSAPYRIVERPDGADGATIARSFLDANPDRMLWGTDWPHTGAWPGQPRMRAQPEAFHPVDDGQQADIFGSWTNVSERQIVLVDNPARLYGFGGL